MVADPTINGELDHAPVPASGPVRALEPRRPGGLPVLARTPSAIAVTAGGLLAAAAFATVRAARARRRLRRRRGRRELIGGRVVARRSFLVDVHLLDR